MGGIHPCCVICLCDSFTQPVSQTMFCQRFSLRMLSLRKQLLCLSETCCACHIMGQCAHRADVMFLATRFREAGEEEEEEERGKAFHRNNS